ncbi:MAG: hybrid sensor histidine kinase/response regulator [Rickettsiales bacterium]|nr:hybrid sensor histidine kinase/response regulator [Rickettsiales bacterium]
MMFKSLKTSLLLFLIGGVLNTWSQTPQIRFEHLDIRDGLSHNRVGTIYQDNFGFMWFGTRSGLNRYDGHNIEVLEFDESDPFSPSDPNVVWLKEGPEQRIWVKSHYGVFAYDIHKEQFVDITALLTELQVNNYNLTDVLKDPVGNYWFVIDNVGVKKYITSEKRVYHYGGSYRDVTSMNLDGLGNIALIHSDGEIELVNVKDANNTTFMTYPDHLQGMNDLMTFVDNTGGYWFYSKDNSFGICYYEPQNNAHKHYGVNELGSNIVTGIVQDENDRIIVGVDHGGMTLINKSDWSYISFVNNPSDPKSLSHNSIISMFQDNNGLVWLGTNKGGVNYFSSEAVSFNFYKQQGVHPTNANDIWPIVEDKRGSLWLGTDGGGLTHFNLKTGKYTNYTHNPSDPNSLSTDIVVSMCQGAKGGLWLGTYFGGLNYFDGKKFKSFYHNEEDSNSISDNSVWNLLLDSKNRLWVGTLKGGVDVYDENFNKLYHFGLSNQTLNSDYITSFSEDQDGRMWIGTGYGLQVFDGDPKNLRHILRETGNPESLSNNSILHIFCDQDNDMWIGTMYGLSKYNHETDKFTNYTKEEGLPENIVAATAQDDEGAYWLSTPKGISKLTFKDSKPTFHNFDISDGLQGDVFNERSVLKLRNGDLAFGGKNGLNIFDPDKIKVNDEESELVFLNFFISNQQVKPGDLFNERVWFENGLNNTEDLVLKHDENSFTVEFTSLSFYRQENINYKYRLIGFDDKWVVRPNIHRANYTNLDPGFYTFEVMASDQTQRWNSKAKTLNIQILSPWWQTPYAYAGYALILMVILFLTRRSIINKERFRARVEQDQFEAKRLHELDLMKIKFFTNISHEFRTPLTLILTPIERLLKTGTDHSDLKHFEMIQRNAKRLLTLVNQLLDFRKMEANQHRLSLATGDLVDFIKSITESFSDLSNDRRVRLHFHSNMNDFLTLFDRDKIEKILFNLLSNAFKFTHSGGKIDVTVKDVAYREDVHTIRIVVTDTGIGIPQERLNDVFNRFFQVDSKSSQNLNHGSGIGLSITKEFVEMHDGHIWVESEVEKGSSFIFELPMKKLTEYHEPTDLIDSLEEEEMPIIHQDNEATIMLTDDNSDFRFYLKDNLKEFYNIYEAPNGKEAWKKILANQPDLVVTDIMMPELNGIELCKKIKNDPRTAHIPVILLTAHYSDDQKLEGFEAGAIEYITKPFNFEILVQAIKSAIQLQKLIHAQEHRVEAKPKEIEITSLDEKFITKALDVVDANISNANFSVQELSSEMAVSRGQLYKKILELTGKTPIEFIREVRIKRAAALLEKSQLNVAEVAYSVGFNNPKYFTKYFKKAYKMLPSKYAQAAEEKNATEL